jgi:hypothetical protein
MVLVTLSTEDGRSEQLELDGALSLSEVRMFGQALFGVDVERALLVLDGRVLPRDGTLASAGVSSGALVLLAEAPPAAAAQAAAAPAAARGPPAAAAAPPPARGPPAAAGARTRAGAGSSSALARRTADAPVYWDGMSIDDVFAHNTNPENIVSVIQAHPTTLLRELNFHNAKLAAVLRDADKVSAVREVRTFLMLQQTSATMDRLTEQSKEREMEARLRTNPMDEEANKFFGEKLRLEQVHESYINMMNNYPEAMTRVLMLYIRIEINGVELQAFVDSGAQTSVISSRCAERCKISRLIDSRFAGTVVGVGTGRTLGKVHAVDMKIEGQFFPVTLTVMDDSAGLGDVNMEFLLGLDVSQMRQVSTCAELTSSLLVSLALADAQALALLDRPGAGSSLFQRRGWAPGFYAVPARARLARLQGRDQGLRPEPGRGRADGRLGGKVRCVLRGGTGRPAPAAAPALALSVYSRF